VASTDLDRVQIMMTRIREQFEKIADLSTQCELELSAAAVTPTDPGKRDLGIKDAAIPGAGSEDGLKKQVQDVANRVTEMARAFPAARQNSKS
jgi:hypothetical protein